jgi:hypothetical protein
MDTVWEHKNIERRTEMCVHPSCLYDLEAGLVDHRGQAGTVGGDTLDDPHGAQFAAGAARRP